MNEQEEKRIKVERFLGLVKQAEKGKLKIYIGMSAGVGKTYCMLQEAHRLLANNITIKIGFVETHNRIETEALIEGLLVIPGREVFY